MAEMPASVDSSASVRNEALDTRRVHARCGPTMSLTAPLKPTIF
jgi:hypothetical protein